MHVSDADADANRMTLLYLKKLNRHFQLNTDSIFRKLTHFSLYKYFLRIASNFTCMFQILMQIYYASFILEKFEKMSKFHPISKVLY